MSTRFRRKRGEDADGGEGRDDAAAEPQETAAGAGGTEATAASPEEVARQRDQYLEMWQRANADYQNLRRRGLSDMENAARRAKESLLHDLLLVHDYLEMALATEVHTDEGRNLLMGVRMTRDELVRVLEREGVRAVPEGGAFDPRVHQAVSTVETDEVEAGQVMATVRRGYVLGEHPLRHAQVQVATAPGEGPGPAERGDESDEQAD